MKFVIKLFPEIIIKSKPVRKRLIKQLKNNIRRCLKPLDEACQVGGNWDRLEIRTLSSGAELRQQYIDKLSCIPGIDYFLEVEEDTVTTLEEIEQIAVDKFLPLIEGKTFCVRVKRTGKHSFTSVEAERQIGAALLRASSDAKVKLKAPDVEVLLELLAERLFTVRNRFPGLGGFPLGFQDSVLSLISGGYDSSVSTFLLNKRGVRTHYCFFNLGGTAHEVGVKQVSHFLWEKYSSSHRVRFISVPFQEVVAQIVSEVHHSRMGVILKRMMLRAAERIANEHEVPAIVTGEAIAQVSSQTMINLKVIDQAVDCLVLRPLVAMDKQEIIGIAREIGTESFAKTMPEYCGVISDKPTTAAKLDRILQDEESFDFSVLDRAIENTKVYNIDEVLADATTPAEVQVVQTPSVADVVIDIRHPNEQETAPLQLTNNEVLNIPFFQLDRKFPSLDQARSYLLYCDKSVMSQMQAQRLVDQGFSNIKVYKEI